VLAARGLCARDAAKRVNWRVAAVRHARACAAAAPAAQPCLPTPTSSHCRPPAAHRLACLLSTQRSPFAAEAQRRSGIMSLAVRSSAARRSALLTPSTSRRSRRS
jgi:hypothetical protein